MKQRERIWCVYWLYDDTCESPSFDGYIGCCSRLDARLRAHRKAHGTYKGAIGVPSNFEVKILYRGPENECLTFEQALRPESNIGWNRERGGKRSPYGHKHTKTFRRLAAGNARTRFKGQPKSPEHREKMRQAALRRYADPAERQRTQRAVKKAFKRIDRSGENNAMYGRHHSEATKQKLRDRVTERGGGFGESNPNYRHGDYVER